MWFAVSCMPKLSSERLGGGGGGASSYDPYGDAVSLYTYGQEPELAHYRSRSGHPYNHHSGGNNTNMNNPQSKSRPSEYIPYGLSPKSSVISPMSMSPTQVCNLMSRRSQ
ncbi:PREDICTED: uncharacterized protein LOC106805678 [Priapulus caudatus]|uniref:Uncharacterized protein LOC106805678 n=1 Tax=Priapulus caudatus TaxID=37621 RepID=A0ABM1DSD2_PRICU|nr:PREDICTED: uncharacterized protein LOC106805678 [Priapulus caudatus]